YGFCGREKAPAEPLAPPGPPSPDGFWNPPSVAAGHRQILDEHAGDHVVYAHAPDAVGVAGHAGARRGVDHGAVDHVLDLARAHPHLEFVDRLAARVRPYHRLVRRTRLHVVDRLGVRAVLDDEAAVLRDQEVDVVLVVRVQ